MAATARILDANLNRAREALRVMEDASRFALNDQTLARDIKRIRHDLRAATDSNCAGLLEANRDSLNDVGTANTTSSELARKGLLDIVIAAGKRLTEALRVIEEFLKIDNPESAEKIKSLRYRAYDIDARLQLRFGTGMTIQWKLCVLLTESMCRHPWREVLRHVIQAGADCIQVREKNLQDAALLDRVREVIAIARPFGVSVIVNDRVDIALAAGADGVHVGQGDLSVRQVRQIAGRNLLVGVSTHDLIEARDAVEAGVDYCGVGAMFSSTIKPEREPSGMKFLREFVAHYPSTPHLAIGGITLDNIAHVRKAGAQGIAVSTAIYASENPGDVTRSMLQAIAVSSSQHNPPSRKVDSRSATPLPQD